MCTPVAWAFFTGFYCNSHHPQQYKTVLLLVKNGRLILTCKCAYMYIVLNYTVRFDSVQLLSALDVPWEICQHFD